MWIEVNIWPYVQRHDCDFTVMRSHQILPNEQHSKGSVIDSHLKLGSGGKRELETLPCALFLLSDHITRTLLAVFFSDLSCDSDRVISCSAAKRNGVTSCVKVSQPAGWLLFPLSKSFLFAFDGSCELVVTLVTLVFIAFWKLCHVRKGSFWRKKWKAETPTSNILDF